MEQADVTGLCSGAKGDKAGLEEGTAVPEPWAKRLLHVDAPACRLAQKGTLWVPSPPFLPEGSTAARRDRRFPGANSSVTLSNAMGRASPSSPPLPGFHFFQPTPEKLRLLLSFPAPTAGGLGHWGAALLPSSRSQLSQEVFGGRGAGQSWQAGGSQPPWELWERAQPLRHKGPSRRGRVSLHLGAASQQLQQRVPWEGTREWSLRNPRAAHTLPFPSEAEQMDSSAGRRGKGELREGFCAMSSETPTGSVFLGVAWAPLHRLRP